MLINPTATQATAADGSAEYPTLIRFLDPAKHSGELLACCISGDVLLWHAPTAKVLGRFSTDGGSLQALDIRRDGQQFASAGESLAIHVFDLDHRKAAAGVLGGFRTTTQLLRPPESHGNRVQVIRYVVNMHVVPNLELSFNFVSCFPHEHALANCIPFFTKCTPTIYSAV